MSAGDAASSRLPATDPRPVLEGEVVVGPANVPLHVAELVKAFADQHATRPYRWGRL